MAIAYQSLSETQKLALSRSVPPRTGESLEVWYSRATGGQTQVAQRPGTVQSQAPPVAIQESPQVGVTALPAALAAILPAGAVAAAGTLYGLAQMVGVQFPWETGPGEGFIAPWTREIKQSEENLWVTRETRPELFAGGTAVVPTAGVPALPGAIAPIGRGVVKTWTANGWPFAMTADANGKHKRIHTVNKDGVPVSWTPYRSIVIGKTLTTSNVKRVATRVRSHVKGLKKVLSILK